MKMKAFAVTLLICALAFSAVPASIFAQKSFAQRSRIDRDTTPSQGRKGLPALKPAPPRKGKKVETKFGSVEAYTDGSGAWLRWQMESEVNNVGFYVHRNTKNGSEIVSDVIPGSAFSLGTEPAYETTYTFFDPVGGLGSTYSIEAIASNGSNINTSPQTASYVYNIRTVKDSDALVKAAEPPSKDSVKVEKDVEITSSELKAEVAAGIVEANPVKHIEVISQPGVRIGVKNDGLIRVTKAQLQTAGFDINGDPNNWQLYLEGVERPMIVGPNADYIEFLGKVLDTVESDIRVFYLINGSGAGRRIQSTYFRPSLGTALSHKYSQVYTKKERTFYVEQILNGDAENYFGRVIGVNPTTLSFDLSGIDQTAGTRRMVVSLQGFSLTVHKVDLTLNGHLLGSATGSSRTPFSGTFDVPVEYLINGTNSLQMVSSANTGDPDKKDSNIFDQLSIDFPRAYLAENDRLDFASDRFRKTISSGFSTPDVLLFDVTSEDNPQMVENAQIVQTNGTWGPVIPAAKSRVYYATEASNYSVPVFINQNDPALIGTPTQGATFVVIAHSSLMAPAQTWANYRAGQGISTKVIDVNEIFDEFNYGVSSANSIRSFLNYAKNNWQTPPDYVLLIGDASWDPKNYSGNGYGNMVPTKFVNTIFAEEGSDEAIADFNGDGLAEIPIGRIASRTAAEVTNVYNKTVLWENNLTPTSLDRGSVFAFDKPDGYDFEAMSDRIASHLTVGPAPIRVDQTSGSAAHTQMLNAFNDVDSVTPANSGVFIANYSGHGTSRAWRDSNLFSANDATAMTNATNPTLITALTCLNAYIVAANGSIDSFAEDFTKAPNGAVAVWASAGLTTPDVQEVMATEFYTQLSAGNIQRLGDLVSDAKAALPSGADVRYSWMLIGDPMLKVR